MLIVEGNRERIGSYRGEYGDIANLSKVTTCDGGVLYTVYIDIYNEAENDGIIASDNYCDFDKAEEMFNIAVDCIDNYSVEYTRNELMKASRERKGE